MLARRKSRILCVQALYAWEMRGQVDAPDLYSFSWSAAAENDNKEDQFWFARQLLAGTLEHVAELDRLLVENIKNWDIQRVNKIDLSILRMSAYCLVFQRDMPRSIVIDEALQIAREYSDAQSYKFINGVLDALHP